MATAIRMPLMGMTMEEGAVTEWLVEDGAQVEKGQEILEFETDKINARVEAPAAGILGGIAAGPGDLVKVQGLLAWILEPGETPPAEDPDPPAAAAAAAAPPAAPPPPSPAPVAAVPAPPPAPVAPAPAPVAAQPVAVAPAATAPSADGRVRASPLAKRVARELGVDLARLVGSGPGGRIIEKDVTVAAAAPAPAPMPAVAAPPLAPAAVPDVAAGQVIPLEGVRRVIAERMLQSLQGSAQVTLVAEADARRFHELRTELASRHESALGFRISYNDLLIRICAHALREHPRANSSLEGDAIRLHDVVNVGLAIEAGGDLVVANVKQADRKSLVEIASDLRGVVDRARANSLDLDDITGGTFTISNLGVYGIDAFTPVLNPPESAILGVGALREKAVARDGQVAAELSMTLSLTFDHRIIDGAPAARFLARIRELIEQPYLLL
ncbi:MAG: dihydrolipoamide acetyltransferase family protein [Chloroflexota bacterium]|nr:dihydrolipoamide acetyltransferase family protein [Chloroflexota bacterium]